MCVQLERGKTHGENMTLTHQVVSDGKNLVSPPRHQKCMKRLAIISSPFGVVCQHYAKLYRQGKQRNTVVFLFPLG